MFAENSVSGSSERASNPARTSTSSFASALTFSRAICSGGRLKIFVQCRHKRSIFDSLSGSSVTDGKKTQETLVDDIEALRRSEERLRLALTVASGGYWDW